MSGEIHPALKVAALGFTGLAAAMAERREPTDDETAEAIGSAMAIVTIAVDAMIRQADALERIAACESLGSFDVRNHG